MVSDTSFFLFSLLSLIKKFGAIRIIHDTVRVLLHGLEIFD